MSEEQAAVEVRVQATKNTYERLRSQAELVAETRTLGDVSTTVSGLPGDIGKLRERGYAFAGYLTARAETLAKQWQEIRSRVEIQIRAEARDLGNAVRETDDLVVKFDQTAHFLGKQRLVEQVEERLNLLERDITGAQSRISALYGSVGRDAAEIKRQIAKFNWYMDTVESATFDFNTTEAVYLVTKAEWIKTGKDKQDPDGLLYLTDQRLIFERKEKEGGFLGLGGKKVQGIEWEAPLGAVAAITSENRGLFGGKDIVYLEFSSGGPGNPTTVEVKGDVKSNWFAQQVERAVRGEIDQERALEIPQEVLAAIKNAPSACESCGAPFTMPITRGMTQIVCEYCGAVTRITG